MAGGALADRTFAAWGEGLFFWREKKLVFQKPGRFGEGGCLTDLDADGRSDVVVTEAGAKPALVWFRGTDGRRELIDSGVVSADVAAATLDGRVGVLVLHKGGQLRFYYRENRAWSVRDVYSFYSAVDQGGLLLSDVDGDGRADIICGNYWVRQPESFELSWRLYAIKLWSDEPEDAMTDFALAGGRLLAMQRNKSTAVIAWFDKPQDPKILWPQRTVNGMAASRPRVAGVSKNRVLISEGGEAGRMLWLHTDGRYEVAATGLRIVRSFLLRDDEIYGITADGVVVIRLERN